MAARANNPATQALDLEVLPLEARVLLGADPMVHRLYYPEGFAGATITEFLPLGNLGESQAEYRVFARFETGERDMELAQGVLAPRSRSGVTISRAGDEGSSLVPWGRPYAVEVVSTSPLVASLSHYDFGAGAGEALVGAESLDTAWTIVGAEVGSGSHDFVVWFNPGDTDATLEIELQPILLQPGGGTSATLTLTTGALRRGGLNLSDPALGHLVGPYTVRVSSDQPIVVAHTSYTRGPDGSPNAATSLADRGPGSTDGVIPLAETNIAPGIQTLHIYNPDPAESTLVSLALSFSDGTPSPTHRVQSIGPRRSVRFDFPVATDLPAADSFSIAYTSPLPVFVRAQHLQSISPPAPAPIGARTDLVSSAASRVAAASIGFADGFMNHARAGFDVFETVGVFNPHSNETTLGAADVRVSIRFNYTDGFMLEESFVLPAGETRAIDLHAFAPVITQSRDFQRHFYSIEVASDIGVVASMWHTDFALAGYHPGGAFSTSGTLLGVLIPFGPREPE